MSSQGHQTGSPATVRSRNGNAVTYHIRGSQAKDIACLGAIEQSAGDLFRSIEGLEAIAYDEPMPVTDLTAMHDAGLLWVAVAREVAVKEDDDWDEKDSNPPVETVVGFLAVFTIKAPSTTSSITGSSSLSSSSSPTSPSDESFFLHIAELSVHTSHQRKGLARSLVTHLVSYAEDMNSTSDHSISTPRALGLTLTTYHDVPFNGPVYAKMGFEGVARNAIDVERHFGSKAREIWDREQRDIAVPEARVWMVRWLE